MAAKYSLNLAKSILVLFIGILGWVFLALPAAAQSVEGNYVPPPPVEAPPLPDDLPPPPDDNIPPPPPGASADNAMEPAAAPDYSQVAPEPDYSNAPPPPSSEELAELPVPSFVPLQAGEAYHTRFSGTVTTNEASGPVTVINLDGMVGSIIDLRNPGQAANGQHWATEPQRSPATAADAGQVFGIAIDDFTEPNIYLTATSAFGLHLQPGTKDWMTGMWGPDAGPGTVYKLSASTGYIPEVFSNITLEGRANSGAALGNVAFDRWNRQLFVSDLETGMIHRLSAADGKEGSYFDHGLDGRLNFEDAWTKTSNSLAPVAFDPETRADIEDCPGDSFAESPECWNYSDFRRRPWGLAVRKDEKSEEIRLYYGIWGSEGFDNPDWNAAGEDRRNSVWSIGIFDDGEFDIESVRREFIFPAFFPADATAGKFADNSNAVTDIEFADCGPQTVMLVAERGAVRNLGLDQENAFARPHASRVLRYEMATDGIWRPLGRYDVSFHERDAEGVPRVRAGGAGGCDFGYGYNAAGEIDLEKPNEFVWMTGDNLCSPMGPCYNPVTGLYEDENWVDGVQGTPAQLVDDVQPSGVMELAAASPVTLGDGPASSYMIDSDINVDANGANTILGLDRNEATQIGDIDIYQPCAPEDFTEFVPIDLTVPAPPPDVHLRSMTHQRNGSPMHLVDRSWHERDWSWHSRDLSWHYRNRSWHSRERSWHDKNLSWHWRDRSWHSKLLSWHDRNRSWHDRNVSWHDRNRSWHSRDRSWHSKAISWHWRNRSWHSKAISWHQRNHSWHGKSKSWHNKARSWHNKTLSWHSKNQSWHGKSKSWHDKYRSWHTKSQSWHGKNRSWHAKSQSWHDKNQSWHDRKKSIGNLHSKHKSNAQHHSRARSKAAEHSKYKSHAPLHSKARSKAAEHSKHKSNAQHHSKARSQAADHSKRKSNAQHHSKARSQAADHSKRKSNAQTHSKRRSQAQHEPKREPKAQKHSKRRSQAQHAPKREPKAQKHAKRRSQAQHEPKREPKAQKHSKRRSQAQHAPQRKSQKRQKSNAKKHKKKKSKMQQY